MSRQRQQRGARNKLGRQRRTNAARAKEVAGAGGEGTDCCWAQRNILRTFAGDLGTSIQETEVSNSQQKKSSAGKSLATGSEISLVLTKMARAQERRGG